MYVPSGVWYSGYITQLARQLSKYATDSISAYDNLHTWPIAIRNFSFSWYMFAGDDNISEELRTLNILQ